MRKVSITALEHLLKVIGEKDACDRLADRLADGSLADVLDRRWSYRRREEIRRLAFVATSPDLGPLIIRPERPFDPAAYFGGKAATWGGLFDADKRSDLLQQIDLREVELKTHKTAHRSPQRAYTIGKRHIELVRDGNSNHILLGPDFGAALTKQPDLYPEEWKDKYVFWSGAVLGDFGIYTEWVDGHVELKVDNLSGNADKRLSALLSREFGG